MKTMYVYDKFIILSLSLSLSLYHSLAVSSCSTKLYAGYSNMQVVTWIKPETDPDETNGDYVVVPSFLAPPPTSAVEKTAQSTSSILKYF